MNSLLLNFHDYLINNRHYDEGKAINTIRLVYAYSEDNPKYSDKEYEKLDMALSDHASWLNNIGDDIYSRGPEVISDDVLALMSGIADMKKGEPIIKLKVMFDIINQWHLLLNNMSLAWACYFVIKRTSNNSITATWEPIQNIISASLPKLGGSDYYNMDNDSFRLLMEVSN